jgi:hypothetical protein
MKSLVLGLATIMFSFQVFAVNEISLGNYSAKDSKGIERVSLTLAAGGRIPALQLRTSIGSGGCNGTYSLAGDKLTASVICPQSPGIHTFLGSIEITTGKLTPIVLEINVAGATNAQMASSAGARVSFSVNDGIFEDQYALFRK